MSLGYNDLFLRARSLDVKAQGWVGSTTAGEGRLGPCNRDRTKKTYWEGLGTLWPL